MVRRFSWQRIASAAIVAGAFVLAAGTASEAASTSYKFYKGGDGYLGPYNGAGTVYAATKGNALDCPAAHVCSGDVIDDPLDYAGGLRATANGGNLVWEDLDPNFGGLGVANSDKGGDDQIEHDEILTLTFDSAVKLTGVGTLFSFGHEDFGAGFGTVGSVAAVAGSINFLLSVDGGSFGLVSFLDANNMALSLVGKSFSFMQAGRNPEFYVSGLTVSAVPLPATFPLMVTGLGLMGWLGRVRRSRTVG